VAHDHRYKAAAGYYICHENGMDTIFNRAIPMFKDRYMWMSGYTDEAKFDRFAKKLTLAGLGARIRCAYLSVAGEDDDLSPIQCTYDLHDAIKAPNTLVVYRGERHGITDNADVRADIADWMRDRLNGKLLKKKRIFKSCRTGLEVA
jgi:pimeloyl-ACP methyl ester carboxylesterase